MNLRRTITRLQQALCGQGRCFKLNQIQSYNETAGKIRNKYILIEQKTATEQEFGPPKRINHTALETYQPIDVVLFLAEEYKRGVDTG